MLSNNLDNKLAKLWYIRNFRNLPLRGDKDKQLDKLIYIQWSYQLSVMFLNICRSRGSRWSYRMTDIRTDMFTFIWALWHLGWKYIWIYFTIALTIWPLLWSIKLHSSEEKRQVQSYISIYKHSNITKYNGKGCKKLYDFWYGFTENTQMIILQFHKWWPNI